MAGHVYKRRRLANRGRRNMSAKQIRYFGTARQKAALKNRRKRSASHHSRRKRNVAHHSRRRRNQTGIISTAEHAAASAIRKVERAAEDALEMVTGQVNRGRRNRRRNVGEILTIVPANPGRKRRNRRMARVHNRRRNRRHNYGSHHVANRRRNATRRRNYRRHNPRRHNRRRNVYAHHRNRYRNRRMHNRRRNPGFMTGTTGAIVGILGGAAVTKVITGFLPAQLNTGFTGMLTTGISAVVVGQVAGKVANNRQFGNWMMIGGLMIVALEVVNQFIPGLNLPFGLSAGTSGMGLISSSNYYVPQVNLPGSMASFVTPAGVTAAIPVVPATGMSGIGGPQFTPGLRTMRRIGRMR